MYFHLKPVSKIIKSCSFVDSVFAAQGFQKKQKKEYHCYCLIMKDNITRLNYELHIPYKEIPQPNKEPLFKIGEIYIYSKSPFLKNHRIPIAVINAAKEKANEVFSYLKNPIINH